MDMADLSIQDLLRMGLNAFALQLLIESLPNLGQDETCKTIAFRFRGALITIEFDQNLDRRHH